MNTLKTKHNIQIRNFSAVGCRNGDLEKVEKDQNCILVSCLTHMTGVRTLVQAVDQAPARHLSLGARVIQHPTAPLQGRLWAWLCHVLLRRHVQPEDRYATQSRGGRAQHDETIF